MKARKISKIVHFFKSLFVLVKFRLSLMVLLSATIGLLYSGNCSLSLLFRFLVPLLGLVFGTCMMNCYIEREIDKRMQRTINRAIAIQNLTESGVISIAFFCMIISIIALMYWVNVRTSILGLFSGIVYLYVYTPLKTKSSMSLYVGAIPGALPPLMGFVAGTDSFSVKGLGLFLLLFIWQIPHFLSIAIYHFNDYRSANIVTLPLQKGIRYTKKNIFFTTLAMLFISLLPYFLIDTHQEGYIFLASFLGIIMGVLAYQGLKLGNSLESNLVWARRYFIGSIIYLPSALLGMLFL